MQLEPKDIYEKLEFDKILRFVEENCLGEMGKEKPSQLRLSNELKVVRRQLKQVLEYRMTIDNDDRFPVRTYDDVSEGLRMLNVEGFVLPEEGLQRINIVLRQMHDIFMFFYLSRQKLYPSLYRIIQNYELDKGLIDAIEKVIDEEGKIKPDASPELLSIRIMVGTKERDLA